jgi:hypothetical protein
MSVETTLEEREKAYGGFINNSAVSQRLKILMRSTDKWDGLRYDIRESLEMIAGKIGRLLAGDSEKADTWHDIAGYALLIEQRITKEEESK